MGVFCPIMVLDPLPDLHVKAMLANRLNIANRWTVFYNVKNSIFVDKQID